MKTVRSFFLLILLFPFFLQSIPANSQTTNYATTYFHWYPGSEESRKPLTAENDFHLQQGTYTVSGPQALSETGEGLLLFLIESEQALVRQYSLNPGTRQFVVPLVPVESLKGSNHQFPIFSKDHKTMVFPFPVVETARLEDPANRFALFSLLHAIIRANLAYGNPERLPVSSHAFRFIDGLSGFLALQIIETRTALDSESYLHILETDHRRRELARQFSATQLLAQNSNSEDTDILAGLNQFFSGIRLTQDSEKASNLPDSSSTADRIRVFQWIQTNRGHKTIANIISYLSRSSDIWTIDEHTEDSFCRQYIRFGCREKTIDGTRSDIILQNATGMNFAQLLKRSYQDTETEILKAGSLPQFPLYGFDFPKAGGANENVIKLHFVHDQATIRAGDILDAETIAMNGASVSLGIRDEAFQALIQINYASGRKKQDEQLMINNIKQTVPQTIASTDLQIGSRIIETGYHSGWVNEIGVFFHWKRLQVEWDTRDVTGKRTQIEYINSGFFLLDIQNYRARMLARSVTLGLNYDLQLGLVNQSGSTLLVRDETYNTDTSNLILGLNLGPELRIQISPLRMDIRLGGAADFLWQPLDDQGGKNSGNNDINASQNRIHLYATLGFSF
ncbi:MAG: hypothetical protein HN580_18050 [Deltaproteobacteria bacterium]|nr:hypothetical protein [Deltaproteobacteria bacterium]MBT4640425.1 hypothetical protein [Deltaproteobacteria bacterium]MBT6500599.1 hypothetical protein [Deltaproteobacteria bacterium]MBT7154386.1 hypothetical protein [Deltaproteobacteria bacterium]MBT7890925.1 hypothetical protein [Deltaproteobacteria bacterium]